MVRFLAGVVFSGAAVLSAAAVEVRVEDVAARAGALAQIRITLAAPRGVAQGGFAVDLDPAAFGDIADVQVYSAAGDAVGHAVIRGRRAEVEFQSPSGGVGRLPDLPVATIAAPVLAGGAVSIAPEFRVWKDRAGKEFAVSARPGVVRLSMGLSIENVWPGVLTRVTGKGFLPGARVEVAGAIVAFQHLVSASQIDFVPAGGEDLTGRRLRVQNPDGESAEFLIAQPGVRDGELRPFFPLRRFGTFRSNLVPGGLGGVRGVSMRNPHAEDVDVQMEKMGLFGLEGRQTIRLRPGEIWTLEDLADAGLGRAWYAGFVASRPVQAVLLSRAGGAPPGPLAVSEATQAYAPFPYPEVLLRVSPEALSFRLEPGAVSEAQRVFLRPAVSTFERIGFEFSIAGAAWLTAERGGEGELFVRASAAGLAVGNYQAAIIVQSTGLPSKPLTIPVTLAVSEAPFISITGLNNSSFSAEPGGPAPPAERFTVVSGGRPAQVSLTAISGGWLRVSPVAGTTPLEVTMTAVPAGLASGGHSGRVRVAGPANTLEIPASLFLAPRPPPPRLEPLEPSGIRLSFALGEAQRFSEFVLVRPFRIAYTVSTGTPWIRARISPVGAGNVIEVEVDADQLPVGTHRGQVRVASSVPGDEQVLPVEVTIWTGQTPALTVGPGVLRLSGPAPAGGSAQILVESGGLPLAVTVRSGMPAGGCELFTIPVGRSGPQPVTPAVFDVACNGPAGDYSGAMTISAGSRTVQVPVEVHIDPPPYAGIVRPPVIAVAVNAASGQSTAVAPGSLLSIHGVGMDVPIAIDGRPVVPSYASTFQANVLAPAEVAGVLSLRIGETDRFLPVAASAPGVFTQDGSGVGQGAVMNEDNSVNGSNNAARRGTLIEVFATGLGRGPVRAFVGGVEAEVLEAPGFDGVWRVKARVPEKATVGEAVSLMLEAAGAPSQPGVTIAVR